MKKYLLFVGILMVSGIATAADSPTMQIVKIRGYMQGPTEAGNVYIHMSSNAFCGTDVFRIDGSAGGAKQAFAIALSAQITGKPVSIEADGCAGWGTFVRSITLMQ